MDMPLPSRNNSKAYSTADAPRSSFKNEMTPVICIVMHN